MTDKELGEAILKLDARVRPPEIDAHEQVTRLLSRDRRQIRLLTIATIVLWVFAAIGIPIFFFLFCQLVLPKFQGLLQEVITHKEEVAPDVLANAAHILFGVTLKMGILSVIASVAALLLAGSSTVWLVFATRRATLREVNLNLAAIADQLKRLPSPPTAT